MNLIDVHQIDPIKGNIAYLGKVPSKLELAGVDGIFLVVFASASMAVFPDFSTGE